MDSKGFVAASWYCRIQRWTVPIEVSNLTASWRRLTLPIAYASQMDRRASSFRYVRGGRPIRLPFARALRIPALTRSTIKLRSSSATAPRTIKTIFPVGVLVSKVGLLQSPAVEVIAVPLLLRLLFGPSCRSFEDGIVATVHDDADGKWAAGECVGNIHCPSRDRLLCRNSRNGEI